MRLLIAVVVGIGLLSLTSCSETQQTQPDNRAPDPTSTALNVDSTKSSATDSHDHGASGRAHDSGAHASHRRGSHGHGHGGHGHSVEDQPGDHSKRIAVGDKVPDFEVSIKMGVYLF